MNSKQKPITPTNEETSWINSHNPEHASSLWRYAAMSNTLDITWLDGYIAPEATYSSQSVFEVLEGQERIREYLIGKFKVLKESGNSALVRAALAELPGLDGDNACVAIFQAQSEFDQSAWSTPVCCMTMKSQEEKITNFLMVTIAPSPANAKVSNLFPMAGTPPNPRPALRGAASYRELYFSLFLLDGECPIDVVARKQVGLAMQHYPGASYREIVLSCMSPEDHSEISELGFFGFPSLAVTLRGQVLYRRTGVIGADNLNDELRDFLAR